MPRTNFNKKEKNTFKYSPETLEKALDEIKQKVLNIHQASVRYGIPYATLHTRIHEKFKKSYFGKGTSPWVPSEFENLLVDIISNLADWGHGVHYPFVRDLVKNYLTSNNIPNRFKNHTPGRDWFYHFLNRWRDKIGTKYAKNMSSARASSCTSDIINNFFQILKDNNIDKIEPNNLWNVDETGFSCDPGKKKILCRKISKNPVLLIGNNEKAHYTVACCCSADGTHLPPFVVYKSKNLYDKWCLGGPTRTVYSSSPSGWMESKQFLQWFRSVFLFHVTKYPGQKVLFLDGHSSHISIELIKLAMENNVKLICLPPNSSHILQPMDVGVFGNVKREWKNILREHYSETKQQNVDKPTFPKLLKRIFDRCFKKIDAKNGFKNSGLYPLSKENIKFSNTAVSAPYDQESIVQSENVTDKNTSSNVTQSTRSKAKSSQPNALIEAAKKSLQKSILDQLQASNNVSKKNNKKIKRPFGEVLTEVEVLKQLEEDEILKNQKSSKRRKKSNGEMPVAQLNQNEFQSTCSNEKDNHLSSEKKCYKCKKKFGSDKKFQKKWISCEKCSNWSCFKCLPVGFETSTEFFCSDNCK